MPCHLTQAPSGNPRPVAMVRLLDRRTGAPLRRDGQPLTIFTRDPVGAVSALLADRDPALWRPLIEALPGTGGSQ